MQIAKAGLRKAREIPKEGLARLRITILACEDF
jgi:hypothetical protein